MTTLRTSSLNTSSSTDDFIIQVDATAKALKKQPLLAFVNRSKQCGNGGCCNAEISIFGRRFAAWQIAAFLSFCLVTAGLITGLLIYEHGSQAFDKLLFPSHFGTVYQEPPPPVNWIDWLHEQPVRFFTPCYNANIGVLRAKVEYLMDGVKDWKIYLDGSDSTKHSTLRQLAEWKEASPDQVILVQTNHTAVEEKLLELEPDARRTWRLAHIRNDIADACRREEPNLPSDTFALVYDGDHWGPMSRTGMLESMRVLNHEKQRVFAVSATGTKSLIPGLIYTRYDWFAYEKTEPEMEPFPLTMPKYVKPVNSSFSGSAVYFWGEYSAARYTGGSGLCEHLHLHHHLREKTGKIMGQNLRWNLYVGGHHSNL